MTSKYLAGQCIRLKNVDNFKYLGTTIAADGGEERELTGRIKLVGEGGETYQEFYMTEKCQRN